MATVGVPDLPYLPVEMSASGTGLPPHCSSLLVVSRQTAARLGFAASRGLKSRPVPTDGHCAPVNELARSWQSVL